MEEESTAASSNGIISRTTARACGKSFTNVNPDLVIFLGAYDTNYDWSDARRESVRYTADLTNLLSAYAFKPKWSFCVPVFRSCLWPVLQQRISTKRNRHPSKSFQAMAILQGENICKSYRDTREMDTRVLRFDHMYDIPRKGKADNNPCFQMMLEMLKTNQIAANSRNVFSMIYQSDAVEFAYRVMMAGASEISAVSHFFRRGHQSDETGES